MSYRVELPVFSGPMDLLLHLVKKQEVSVHEVSISNILDQYLKHLELLAALDLADIGDFVVMASTLMEIKSRELLPRDEVSLEDDLDPRDDLIQRLLEYKRYRDISRRLARLAARRARMGTVSLPMPPRLAMEDHEELLDLGEVEIWNLTEAFARLLEETGQSQTMRIEIDRRDAAFYIGRVLKRVVEQPRLSYHELFDPTEGSLGLIGVFVAMLEMMKQGYLVGRQEDCFGPILITFKGPADLTVEEILAPGAEEEEPVEEVPALGVPAPGEPAARFAGPGARR